MAKDLETVVRFCDEDHFPRHTSLDRRDAEVADWPNWRGKPIRIIAKAIEPDSVWRCGTHAVWRVPTKQVLEVWPECPHPHKVFVCCHQVQVGD